MSQSSGVDSFDSKLLVIRAKGGGWDFKTTRLSVLVVVIHDNSKQYSRLAVGCLAANQGVLQMWSGNVRLTDTSGGLVLVTLKKLSIST